MNEKLVAQLKKSGFSGKEATIYIAVLDLGGAFPSRIAEETKLNRTTVYKILETLSIRGLVTEIQKRGKYFYQAEHPKALQRFMKSHVTQAKRHLEQIQETFPTLEGLFIGSGIKPVVRFFEGRDGVLDVYRDHVEVKKPYEMKAFSNTSDLMRFLPKNFRMDYIKKKEKLDITTRAILPNQDSDLHYNETIYKHFSRKIWPSTRHISRDIFPYKSDITVYGENKVSIINFQEPQFSGTIIQDKTIHDMLGMIFELAWKGAEK